MKRLVCSGVRVVGVLLARSGKKTPRRERADAMRHFSVVERCIRISKLLRNVFRASASEEEKL